MKFPVRIIFLLVILMISGLFSSVLSAQVSNDNFGAITLYNLAVDKTALGQFDEAVNLTDQALAIQPNFTLALVTRTGALLELNRTHEAEESIHRAIILAPEDPVVLAAAASVSLQKGNNHEAIEYAQKSVFADSSFVEAWIIKGTAHGNLGEYSEEINASEQALKVSPDNPLALSNREYAKNMLNQTQKSPLGFPGLIIALLCSVFIAIKRRS